jgi:dipeptidyl aminopeptidase/acylaminoacyl peptidase
MTLHSLYSSIGNVFLPGRRARLSRIASAALIFIAGGAALAQESYRKPPKDVLDVLNAPLAPTASLSPSRDFILFAQGVRYPPISELAQPMLRLAGLRINPHTNGRHRAPYFVKLWVKRISDGAETEVVLPLNAEVGTPQWSADGRRFAFTNTTANGIELWVGETETAKVRKIEGVRVNAVMQNPVLWMPDNRTLLVQSVPAKRAAAPPGSLIVPREPVIQESSGRPGPVRTYQDLLTDPHDEVLFDYYATAQLALVDSVSGAATPLGQPAIFETIDPAPDGMHILVARLQRPYSYLHPYPDFPKAVEVWDRSGQVVHKLASLPLADQVPIEGVPVGPREYHWRPAGPTTLVWAEALDEGDPRKKVSPRDRVLMLRAPFKGKAVELIKTEHRFTSAQWGERDGLVLISDYDRDQRRRRTFILNADNPAEQPRLVWNRNIRDQYNNPGTPVMRTLPGGQTAILQHNDSIYLTGTGATPEGDRPFLDRLNLQTLKAERLFRSDETSYETVVGLLTDDAKQFVTRRERPIEPLNYYVRTLSGAASAANAPQDARPLTRFPDPAPQLRGIRKQLVTYKRADGVQLSFTLYLPPGYKEGTRLPTVVWAYPLEYTDPSTAGQVTGSTQRFTTIMGPSHLFFMLAGYAVLDNATMPVVGDPETMNNTYIEQVVMSARAAVDKAVELGVTDPERVGVGGHSYGAFMTANLLAHSDLFRAGIARSGAYNRTLTPFGFQTERRTLWDAPELYLKVSPFMYANRINEPLLLIHGEADNNPGTFPIQSERLYQAVRGTGGTVRLVLLPLESHGYTARESTEHTLYEMISWFDKYVKNAQPRKPKEEKAVK